MSWGHLTWPGDLPLHYLVLKFSQHMPKRCMMRCAKYGGSARRCFLAIWKKIRREFSTTPIRANVKSKLSSFSLSNIKGYQRQCSPTSFEMLLTCFIYGRRNPPTYTYLEHLHLLSKKQHMFSAYTKMLDPGHSRLGWPFPVGWWPWP